MFFPADYQAAPEERRAPDAAGYSMDASLEGSQVSLGEVGALALLARGGGAAGKGARRWARAGGRRCACAGEITAGERAIDRSADYLTMQVVVSSYLAPALPAATMTQVS